MGGWLKNNLEQKKKWLALNSRYNVWGAFSGVYVLWNNLFIYCEDVSLRVVQ